jgi:hypothetical protein
LAVSSNLLSHPNCVPERRFRSLGQFDFDLYVRLAARRKAPNLRKTASSRDRCLQSAAGFRNVAKEAENVEKVRFSGSVWADHKNPISEPNIDGTKVAPVL